MRAKLFRWEAICTALFIAAIASSPAYAGEGQQPTISLRSTGDGSAAWIGTSDSDGDGWAIDLVLPDSTSTAFIDFGIGNEQRLPLSEPSFYLKGTGSQFLGPPWHGGVSLNIQLNDGGYIVLQPAQWFSTWEQVSGSWTTTGGSGTFNGSPCGRIIGVSYSVALACHAKATMTYASISSFPVLGTGTNLLVDNIDFRVTFTDPSRSREGMHDSLPE